MTQQFHFLGVYPGEVKKIRIHKGPCANVYRKTQNVKRCQTASRSNPYNNILFSNKKEILKHATIGTNLKDMT